MGKNIAPVLALCLLLTSAFVLRAETAVYEPWPRDRYDVILEKLPFGPLPAGFTEPGTAGAAGGVAEEVKIAAPEEVVAAQEELSGKIRLQCVNIAPCGDVMVGFLDESDNATRYYLAIGDSHRGFSVLDADYDREWAQIVKDGVMVTMKLGEGKIEPPDGSAGASFVFTNITASAAKPTVMRPGATRINFAADTRAQQPATAQNANDDSSGKTSSFVERLRQREAEKRKRAEKDAEEQKQRLREMVRAAAKAEIEKQKREAAEQESEASNDE